ncbi:MAG: hypothetical protein P1U58_07035 [Verrucomicrobiales bacterium]|nr:hypothetical protein [Verrucomicrobiales bacterium]
MKFASLLSALLCLTSLHAQNGVPHVIIEDTTSPDGRYAVAWGIPYESIDLGDTDNLDLERVENFLVDLTTGSQIATLGTTYFATPDFVKNHGSLSTAWRSDSRGLFIVEGAKWGFDSASVIYITDPEKDYDQCSDLIPLSKAIRTLVHDEMKKQHPELGNRVDDFVVSAYPQNVMWEDTLTLVTGAEIPKDPDSIYFEKSLTVSLPGPITLKAGGSLNEGSNSPEFLITASAAGSIELGMTIGEARQAMPGATFERTLDGEGIAYVAVIQDGETLMELHAGEYDSEAPINNGAKIEFLQVWSPRFKTADGIGTGTEVSVAENVYGGIGEIMMSEIESREYATFTNQPSGLSFRLTNENGDAGDYANDNITTRYLPGASILAIEVMGPYITQDGSIGGIKLDADAEAVFRLAGQNRFGVLQKGEDEIWEAFGQAVQTWNFPQAGISFDMISDEIGGPKTVFSITATPPFNLATGQGIQMGDPKTKVLEAYRAYESTNEEMDGYFDGADVHLVGSIYGGMIFTFDGGKLTEIFLGAAAE